MYQQFVTRLFSRTLLRVRFSSIKALNQLLRTYGHKACCYISKFFHNLRAVFEVYVKWSAFYVVGAGTSTSLALSFFKHSNESNNDLDKNLMLMREADLLYDTYLIDNAYNILRKFRNCEETEWLWRLARVLCEKGKLCKNDEEKKRLFKEALEFADKALKNEPVSGCSAAHKWYAIILDYVGEQEGTKFRIQKALDVKRHLERALEINPIDATTWHILGVWHFTFADMNTMTYLIAKTVYATPPVSTYEEALRHFEKAEAINPGFYSANVYYLAMVKERLKNNNEARELFKKAFFSPVVTADDNDIHQKASEHLKKKYGLNAKDLLTERNNAQ